MRKLDKNRNVTQEYLDYVSNLERQDLETFYIGIDLLVDRLNNNINKGIEAINVYQNEKTLSIGYEDLKRIRGILRGNEFDLKMFEKHLKELRGDDKE